MTRASARSTRSTKVRISHTAAAQRKRRSLMRQSQNLVVADTTNHGDDDTTSANPEHSRGLVAAFARRCKIGPARTVDGGHPSFYASTLATSLWPFSIQGLTLAQTQDNLRFTFHQLWYLKVTFVVTGDDGQRQWYRAEWPIKPRSRRKLKASDKWRVCRPAVREQPAVLVSLASDNNGVGIDSGSGSGVSGSYSAAKMTKRQKAKAGTKKKNKTDQGECTVTKDRVSILALDAAAASTVITKGGDGKRKAQHMTMMLANRPFALSIKTATKSATSRVRVERFECVYNNEDDSSNNVSKTNVVWCNGALAIDTAVVSSSFRTKLAKFGDMTSVLEKGQVGRAGQTEPAKYALQNFERDVLGDPFTARLVTGDGGGASASPSCRGVGDGDDDCCSSSSSSAGASAGDVSSDVDDAATDVDDNDHHHQMAHVDVDGDVAPAITGMHINLNAVDTSFVLFGERRVSSSFCHQPQQQTMPELEAVDVTTDEQQHDATAAGYTTTRDDDYRRRDKKRKFPEFNDVFDSDVKPSPGKLAKLSHKWQSQSQSRPLSMSSRQLIKEEEFVKVDTTTMNKLGLTKTSSWPTTTDGYLAFKCEPTATGDVDDDGELKKPSAPQTPTPSTTVVKTGDTAPVDTASHLTFGAADVWHRSTSTGAAPLLQPRCPTISTTTTPMRVTSTTTTTTGMTEAILFDIGDVAGRALDGGDKVAPASSVSSTMPASPYAANSDYWFTFSQTFPLH